MDSEIVQVKPKGLEPYPRIPNFPDVKAEAVDVPMCPNPISDTVHWADLTKLFIRESVISYTILMKGKTMNNDNKATATGIATGVIALAGLFGFAWPVEIITGIVTVGMMVLGYFTNKKDTPAV